VRAYIATEDPEQELVVGDLPKIQCAFSILRSMVLEGGGPGPAVKSDPQDGISAEQAAANDERIRRLQLQVTQRDNEISILVGMLKKKKGPSVEAETQTGAKDTAMVGVAVEAGVWRPDAPPQSSGRGGSEREVEAKRQQMEQQAQQADEEEEMAQQGETDLDDMELLKDRNKAFESFRKSYRRNEVIESQKQTLREKYGEAKATGEVVNATRSRINSLKAQIEQRRVERAMQSVAKGEESAGEDPQEGKLREGMEREKANYKTHFEHLKELKAEIEHIQHLLETSRVRLQKDFEQWFEIKVGGVKKDRAKEKAQERAAERAQPREQPKMAAALPVHQPVLSTGNQDADADIAAFYAARDELMRR